MATKKPAYVPSMKDEAVRAKTGRNWNQWFILLDKAGAAKLGHTAIAELLSSECGVSGWWSQTVTVEYERARGLRNVHETADGYSVSVTKTIATTLPKLYAASAETKQRAKWLPKGSLKISSQTKDKYINGAWKDSARLNIGFYAKGEGKAQIAVQVSKLAKKADIEAERTVWKAALARLQEQLE
jgi:hypothetical protein